MKKILSFMAYLWAGISFILLLSVFLNMNGYQQMLLKLPFMKVDPLYTGGEIDRTVECGNYSLQIHEPVFSALFGESKKGYVQVDVLSSKDCVIKDSLDINQDGIVDFCLQIKDKEIMINQIGETRYDLGQNSETEFGWIVRVEMDNPRK